MRTYLDLSDAPLDPIKRIMWLGGMNEAIKRELDAAFAEAYYMARLRKQLDAAHAVGLHSHKAIMAFTRRENERRGRMVRWGDKFG